LGRRDRWGRRLRRFEGGRRLDGFDGSAPPSPNNRLLQRINDLRGPAPFHLAVVDRGMLTGGARRLGRWGRWGRLAAGARIILGNPSTPSRSRRLRRSDQLKHGNLFERGGIQIAIDATRHDQSLTLQIRLASLSLQIVPHEGDTAIQIVGPPPYFSVVTLEQVFPRNGVAQIAHLRLLRDRLLCVGASGRRHDVGGGGRTTATTTTTGR
jgi:hypothetical protein